MKKQKVLSIYVNLQDRELGLPSYLKDDKFIISICPASIMSNTFSEKSIEEVKALLERGCLLGQRSYMGRCKYSHDDGTDPWHENYCLYNPSLSSDIQLELMSDGREVLKKMFGIYPIVYALPNHLWDVNTRIVAEILKYRYLMDQNNIGLEPYEIGNMIIIPEAKIGDKEVDESVAVYCHVDQLRNRRVSDFIKNVKLVSPLEMRVRRTPPIRTLTKNELIKLKGKIERDLRNIDKR